MNKVPKLRFPEFSGEWKEKELGEICEVSKAKYNPEKEIENFKCLELEHFSQGTGRILGFCDSLEQKSVKNRFQTGEVLFGKLRPYLKKYWKADFDGVCSSEIWVMRGKMISNDFLYRIVQSNKFNLISNISAGSKMPRADWDYMVEFPFFYPTLSEQQEIASFLSSVDSKIEKLERKKELWEQYKKGMMQKIFSQELRFKDENGNDYPKWEEKRFGEIGETFNGLTGKTKEDFGSGKPYITYKSIFDSNKINLNRLEYVNILENENQNTVQYGDIFFTTSSETPNEIGMTSVLLDDIELCYLNSFCFGFRLKNKSKILPNFMRFYLRSEKIRDEIVKLAQGSTRYNLSKIGLMKLYLDIPSHSEQTQIADFLSSIDSKIEIIDKELDGMKEFKKGLLQQMFV